MAYEITYLVPFRYFQDLKLLYATLKEYREAGAKYLVFSENIAKTVLYRPEMLDKWLQVIRDAGMEFRDSHALFGGPWDMNCPYEELTKRMINTHRQIIDIISSIGIDTITIHPGSPRYCFHVPLEKQWETIVANLSRILPYASRHGVTVNIENSWTQNNSPDRLLDYRKKVNASNLGFCYDSGHANIAKLSPNFPNGAGAIARCPVGSGQKFEDQIWEDHCLEKILPYVTVTHIHDNDGSKDMHKLPGFGNVDFKHVVGLLKTAPNLKYIHCEVKSDVHSYPISLVVRTMRQLFE